MKYVIILFTAIILFQSTGVAQVKRTALTGSALNPVGRYDNNDGSLELISSASHTTVNFSGEKCAVYYHLNPGADHNYLQYELDGKYMARVRIREKHESPLLITPGTGKHVLAIYKTTEATTGAIFIDSIVAPKIQASMPHKNLKIEFIGNSITCGAAADPSETPCGTGEYLDQHNAYYAYGPRIARALNAEFMLSSVSGIGVYRNWNSLAPTMPQVYDFTKLQPKYDDSIKWDFSLFQPDIVSIALGTNDFSNGDGKKERLPFDSAIFISTYVKFVEHVKSKYPDAKIALLSSPMVSGENGKKFEACLSHIKATVDAMHADSNPVAVFFFKPMKAHGCSGHPSVEEHGQMAAEALPFFKQLLAEKARVTR